MQLTTPLFLALTAAPSLITAVSFSDVPACARTCATALPASCNGSPSCICNDNAWLGNVACCVDKACSKEGYASTFAFAKQVCGYMGVQVGNVTCAKGAGA